MRGLLASASTVFLRGRSSEFVDLVWTLEPYPKPESLNRLLGHYEASAARESPFR